MLSLVDSFHLTLLEKAWGIGENQRIHEFILTSIYVFGWGGVGWGLHRGPGRNMGMMGHSSAPRWAMLYPPRPKTSVSEGQANALYF